MIAPTITNITYALYNFISNHPLIANPPVYHPLTKEQIKIQKYRLYDGLNVDNGLVCSIYPFPGTGDEKPPNPRTTSVSVMYDTYDLGESGCDKAVYHIAISLFYNELAINNIITDTVPDTGVIHPNDILLTSSAQKSINLEINPGISIIGDYLDLLRLVISDRDYKPNWPMPVNSFEAVYGNLKTNRWESERIYFQEGTLMTRLDAYISRGWRDKFIQPLEDINIKLN